MNDKVLKVVYSPDFGGGLSTWNPTTPIDVTDDQLAALVERGHAARDWSCPEAWAYLDAKYPGAYLTGELLAVAYVPPGHYWRIVEHNGSEYVEVSARHHWHYHNGSDSPRSYPHVN